MRRQHERRCLKIHAASQGLRRTTPRPAKSFTFRVTSVRSCSRAVAAIMPSAVLRGVPRNWHSPPRTDALGHRQDSAGKQRKEVLLKPLFQLRSPLALGKNRKAPAKFSDGDDAQV